MQRNAASIKSMFQLKHVLSTVWLQKQGSSCTQAVVTQLNTKKRYLSERWWTYPEFIRKIIITLAINMVQTDTCTLTNSFWISILRDLKTALEQMVVAERMTHESALLLWFFPKYWSAWNITHILSGRWLPWWTPGTEFVTLHRQVHLGKEY